MCDNILKVVGFMIWYIIVLDKQVDMDYDNLYNEILRLLTDKNMNKAELYKTGDIAPNTVTKLR